MNIFLTDYNSVIAVSHLDDLRLNKMIIETAQIISQSYRRLISNNDDLYKDTHINHPCCKWARKNMINLSWLIRYFINLYNERVFRFNRGHKTYDRIHHLLHDYKDIYSDNIIFDFDCSLYQNDDFDLTEKYKKTLLYKWKTDIRIPKWTNRNKPPFKS